MRYFNGILSEKPAGYFFNQVVNRHLFMLEPNALPNHEQIDQMMNHKVDIMVNRLVDRLTEIVNRMVDWLIELVNLMICSKTPVHIYYSYRT